MNISSRSLLLVSALTFAFASPRVVEAQVCLGTTRTPAVPVPEFGPANVRLWGALEPVDQGPLPRRRDSTDRITGFEFPNSANPNFRDVDHAGGLLFATMPYGFDYFGVRNETERRSPVWLNNRDGYRGDFMAWNVGGENNRPFLAGDAVVIGNNAVHIAVGTRGVVVHRISLTAPTNDPVIVYQDWHTGATPELKDVEIQTIDGRAYAFVSGPHLDAVRIYDLTQAAGLTTPCLEDVEAGQTGCGVVESTQLFGGGEEPDKILAAKAELLAYGSNSGAQLFDLSNGINAPTFMATVGGGSIVRAVEIFQNVSGQFGLATRSGTTLRIYNITSCVNSVRGGGSCSIGNPVFTNNDGATNMVAMELGGKTVIHTMKDVECPSDGGDEFLYDVSNLGAITDLMPHATDVFTADGHTHPASYTSYYAGGRPATGFRKVQPWSSEAVGPYLYRSQTTILDIHELVNLEPSITVTGPSQTYAGLQTTFTGVAANCDAGSGTWNWDPNPDTIVGNTARYTFPSPGPVSISATNTACPTATVNPLAVTVLDPEPAIQAFRVNGQNVGVGTVIEDEMCSLLTFSLVATGQPPLTYSWQILDAQQSVVASSSAATFPWDTSQLGTTTGAQFEALVDLSNASGSASTSRDIDLADLPQLAFGQAGGHPVCGALPSACSSQSPPGTGNVTLYANSVGANAWKWEYRAEGSSGPWTLIADFGSGEEEDSVQLTLGDWEVRSTIRNCINETLTSVFDVIVDQDDPVTAAMTPSGCQFGCEFPAPRTQLFVDHSTGPVESWAYDFLHQGSSTSNCNFGPAQAQPQTSFVYTTPGSYRPCVRVVGPSNTDVALTDLTITITSGNPPSISVSCPSSASVGTPIFCSASAQNCSPGSSSWNWTTQGGSISGSSNGSSINVSWGTPGNKTVTATNSQCTGASGNDFVNVTTGGGGGSLNAAFTFTPAQPQAGQTINLDGSSSTGSIVAYSWLIDPPSGANITRTGVNASFVPTVPGQYEVSLDVFSQVGCGSPSCQDSETMTITVGGQVGPVTANFTVAPASPVVGQQVTFDTSSSAGPVVNRFLDVTAPGGGTTSYSGQVAPQHVFTQTGVHTVELTVTNQQGCSEEDCQSTATRTVNVGAAVAPTAAVVITPQVPVINESMRIDSSGSSGPIVSRRITVQPPSGAPTNFTSAVADFVPTQLGNHLITVEVETVTGCVTNACQDIETRTVEVVAFAPLEARWVVSPDPPRMGEVAVFSASSSLGNPTSYEWTIGGLTLTGESVAVQLADMGDLAVNLTIRRGGESDSVSDLIRVFGPCVDDPSTLCFGEGRFRVHVDWEDVDGNFGAGQIRPEKTDSAGMFWFFNPDNVEQLVKVLDGCAITGHYWVLAAALTDVEYELMIEDLIAGATYMVENPLGTASPATVDTGALATCDVTASVAAVPAQSGRLATDREIAELEAMLREREATPQAVTQAVGLCSEGPAQACFIDGRFRAEISFSTHDGQSGLAQVGVLDSDNTGVFYFFDPTNLEVVAKVIDGCELNDHFWVFAAATTDQQYTLRVTDTQSGQSREYFNELGSVSSAITDVDAFETCGDD